jgi:eukaryotic-like serine/threonine-protein kinase
MVTVLVLYWGGASGEVYDAVEDSSTRRFAIKLLLGQSSQSPDHVARFKREGEISIEIASSHVAKVSRVGCSASGILYILMERLEGDDLARLLRERGRLSLRSAITMVSHVCRGLEKAHQSGVIHRDVKPHNIFLHRPGGSKAMWKVLDFGISKWATGNSTITKLGGVVGTPRYMSPEQARGEEVDHRSDIYSLGAVLYRSVTGLPPYSAGGLGALSAAAFQRPVNPRRLVPTLDSQIAAVLAVAMAPKPEQRFSSADDFSKALKSAAEGRLDDAILSFSRSIEWSDGGAVKR